MKGCRLEVAPGAALLYPLLYFLDDSGVLAAVVPAVVIHELGHAAAAVLCGVRVRTVRLELPGLCMETDGFPDERRELLCLLAGPAAGLLWAVIAWGLGGGQITRTALAALVVNGFNLLPALPLDGGRILRLLTGSERAAYSSTVLCAAAFFTLAAGWRLWPCLVPVFLFARELITA